MHKRPQVGPFALATCNYLLSWELKDNLSSLFFTIGIAINGMGILPNYTLTLLYMFFFHTLAMRKTLVVVNNVFITPYISMKNGVD